MARAVIALALATLLGGWVAGCAEAPSAEGGFVSGDGSVTKIAVEEREPAPVLKGVDLDGNELDSASFDGKILVYNVWGSWCAPCRAEAPALVAASDETADSAQFLGINTRDLDTGPAQAFVRTQGIEFPSFYDPQGELLLEFESEVSPNAIPTTIVVDEQGRLAARILGEATEATVVGLVNDIAAGR